jgi:mono/diheme cytochrome c family protein
VTIGSTLASVPDPADEADRRLGDRIAADAVYRIAAVSRPRANRLIPLIVAGVALTGFASGCDPGQEEDFENGRALFIEKCGTCHALDEAATTAEVGPDLDAAFAAARDSGMDSDTIEGVVEAQIDNPRATSPDDTRTYMPADLVTGEDAGDVAHYVGRVAGVPGIEPPQVPGGPGAQVFAQNGCGSCHTLSALPEALGTVGPNLDEVIPDQSAQQVEQSIVDPNAEIAQGFDAGVMPQNYGETLDEQQIRDVVEYLLDEAGKSGGGK